MSESVPAPFWFIINKKNTNKFISSSLQNDRHSEIGSCIFDTGHMTGSGATTCK